MKKIKLNLRSTSRRIKPKKTKPNPISNETESLIVTTLSELYKFNATFSRMLSRIPENEAQRYLNKYQWFSKKIIELADSINVQAKDFTGMEFDPGLPVAVLNLGDFSVDDSLIISQMIEPVMMKDGKLVKTGTAMVSEKEKE